MRILDAGCGTGLLAQKLGEFGTVDALDMNPLACDFARARGVNVAQASVTNLPFPDNTFDIVVCVDVIYHQSVSDDQKALAEMARVLKQGGKLILRAPALSWLRSSHDVHVHTRERYDKAQLFGKIQGAGLSVEKLSFVGMPLLPAAWFRHLTRNKATIVESGVKRVPRILNFLIQTSLYLENLVVSYAHIPYGIGLFAVARKPT